MTPFGLPISKVTIADLHRLIDDEAPEGRHLEYKADIPVSDGQQRQQREAGIQVPTDRGWITNKPLMEFGRDELMEELVAFANADGGVLILGMAESGGHPATAAGFNPLPDVAALERRLRDVIVTCIEPRLPYAAVRGLPTEPDGAGVVLLEIEPSRLGPHRVRRTREATIRREDSCVPMSMVEIHDTVLRNARRFDAVTALLEERSRAFQPAFVSQLLQQVDGVSSQLGDDERVGVWLQVGRLAACALRVTLVPHDNLNIPRLERLDGLVPAPLSIRQGDDDDVPGANVVWISQDQVRRVLGGIEQVVETHELVRVYRIMREGLVEATTTIWGKERVHAFVPWLAAMVGCVLEVYERLRASAGTPSMPAEIGVEVLTRGEEVRVRPGASYNLSPAWLPNRTLFPTYTISDRSSFTEAINAIAGDLVNAGDWGAGVLPKFWLMVE